MRNALLVGSFLGVILSGCTSETQMQLRLENLTPAGATNVPAKAEVRLVAVTVYHEVAGQLITPELVAYVHPDCGGSIDCDLPRVKSFFDLALSTGALTDLVGVQRLAVRPEKVNRARAYFCRTAGLGLTNGKFIAGSMTTAHEYEMTSCSAPARAIEPEVQLISDNLAILTLQYDLTETISTPGTGPECERSASNLCFRVPTFTAVIGQQALGLGDEERDNDGGFPR